jgi:hypothetical protein
MLGQSAGLYIAAIASIVLFAFLIVGAWLLMVGIHEHQAKQCQPWTTLAGQSRSLDISEGVRADLREHLLEEAVSRDYKSGW